MDFEILERVALEDGPTDTDHAGPQLVQGKDPALGGEADRQKTHQGRKGQKISKHGHELTLMIRVNP